MTGIDYDEASATYDGSRTTEGQLLAAILAEGDAVAEFSVPTAVGAGPRAIRVLDFGCGTGNYLAALEAARPAWALAGVEPSAGMRDRAKAKLARAQVLAGDHSALPLPDGSVDLAFMTDVVHHVPDLPAMFAALARVLAPGGRLLIATQSHEQIGERFYSEYFPGAVAADLARYPDIPALDAGAKAAGLSVLESAELPGGSRRIDGDFIALVQSRGYSMFRLLSDEEVEDGLSLLERDFGSLKPTAGTTVARYGKK